jgi:hypothetical protein
MIACESFFKSTSQEERFIELQNGAHIWNRWVLMKSGKDI